MLEWRSSMIGSSEEMAVSGDGWMTSKREKATRRKNRTYDEACLSPRIKENDEPLRKGKSRLVGGRGRGIAGGGTIAIYSLFFHSHICTITIIIILCFCLVLPLAWPLRRIPNGRNPVT